MNNYHKLESGSEIESLSPAGTDRERVSTRLPSRGGPGTNHLMTCSPNAGENDDLDLGTVESFRRSDGVSTGPGQLLYLFLRRPLTLTDPSLPETSSRPTRSTPL